MLHADHADTSCRKSDIGAVLVNKFVKTYDLADWFSNENLLQWITYGSFVIPGTQWFLVALVLLNSQLWLNVMQK